MSPDIDQIIAFHTALFKHGSADTFIAARAFRDDGTEAPPFLIQATPAWEAPRVVYDMVAKAAQSNFPVVVAPPIATFKTRAGAAESDLAEGVAISVDADKTDPDAAREVLTKLLGEPTVVVASGGEWTDPATGEVRDRLHLHWRLAEPTRDLAGHRRLKLARELAAQLVGGDPSAGPVVHPFRWPGTLHMKREPHRLANIVAIDHAAEIDLDAALTALQGAVGETARAKPDSAFGALHDGQGGSPGDLLARDILDVAAALAAVPNSETVEWADWNKIGLAAYSASGGHDAGFAAWLAWSAKASKHESAACRDRWQHYRQHDARNYNFGPEEKRAGMGTLVQLARQAVPGWQLPSKLVRDARHAAPANDAECPLGKLDFAAYRLDRLASGEPPERQFLLEPLMPLGVVGLLFGEGGLGKSMEALALAILVARAAKGNLPLGLILNGPLGGAVPQSAGGASIFLTLEDDKAEVHRRTLAVDAAGARDGAPCFVIPALDLHGFDPALIASGAGRLAVLTDFAATGLDELLGNVSRASGLPVRLLILDPAGDFLDADENDAGPVKKLMRLLREKATAHGCTILLLGHVAKGGSGTSMRGSSAWVANARFAYSLRRPDPKADDNTIKTFKKAGIGAERLVIGCLTKANHAGAPLHKDRFFVRCEQTGRLVDQTRTMARPEADEALLAMLVARCLECAAVGHPFKLTGNAGLYAGRATLGERLSDLTRKELEALGAKAVELGRLLKCSGPGSRAPDYLDVPTGPFATKAGVTPAVGSREEALAIWRRAQADRSAKSDADGRARGDDPDMEMAAAE